MKPEVGTLVSLTHGRLRAWSLPGRTDPQAEGPLGLLGWSLLGKTFALPPAPAACPARVVFLGERRVPRELIPPFRLMRISSFYCPRCGVVIEHGELSVTEWPWDRSALPAYAWRIWSDHWGEPS
jgi:hypothetical protein